MNASIATTTKLGFEVKLENKAKQTCFRNYVNKPYFLKMHRAASLCITLLFCAGRMSVNAQLNGHGINVTINPMTADQTKLVDPTQMDILRIAHSTMEPNIQMFMDRELVSSFNYTIACSDLTSKYTMVVTSNNQKIIRVPETKFAISCTNASLRDSNMTSNMEYNIATYAVDGQIDVKLMSGVIGYVDLEFTLSSESLHDLNDNETISNETESYDVVVIRKLRPVDRIFRIVVYCVQVFVLTGFGAKLDLQVVKETLRRPIAPGIGFCCQYIMMPLVSAVQNRVTVRPQHF